MGHLYVIRNKINGKEYVGKTCSSMEKRFKEHIRDSRKERNQNRPLYRAFRKYGIENFEVSHIGTYPPDELEKKEIEEILRRNTYHYGYNATFGGDGKRRVKLNPEDVYQVYKKEGTIMNTAKALGHNHKTIAALLAPYDLPSHYNYKRADGHFLPKIIECKSNDIRITFDSINKATFFIREISKEEPDNGQKTKKTVTNSIVRVLNGQRKSFLKLHWSYYQKAS